MSDLPPDPPRLRAILAHLDRQLADTDTIRTYLQLQRDTVHQALAAADGQAGRQQQTRPQPPALEAPPQPATGYTLERKLRDNHPLGAAIHLADCTMTQRGTRPISADDAREALAKDASFFRACEFCRPDTKLGILEG